MVVIKESGKWKLEKNKKIRDDGTEYFFYGIVETRMIGNGATINRPVINFISENDLVALKALL
jgi:hypothetical protein